MYRTSEKHIFYSFNAHEQILHFFSHLCGGVSVSHSCGRACSCSVFLCLSVFFSPTLPDRFPHRCFCEIALIPLKETQAQPCKHTTPHTYSLDAYTPTHDLCLHSCSTNIHFTPMHTNTYTCLPCFWCYKAASEVPIRANRVEGDSMCFCTAFFTASLASPWEV